jgi:hypothetical protein
MVADPDCMSRPELINQAVQRLVDRHGTEENKREPHKAVLAELITKTVQAAVQDDSGDAMEDLRAALLLVAPDQQAADSREVNVTELLRRRGVSWREIAWRRGLGSAQRAQQRFQHLTRGPTVLIYAFRVAGEEAGPWRGEFDVLPEGGYETGVINFIQERTGPYSGRTLEVRYGDVGDDGMEPYLRAYAMVNYRRIGLRADVQHELFGA